MTWLARALSVMIVVMLALMAQMRATASFDPPPEVPRGLGSPILGIELARDVGEVRGLLRDPIGWHNRAVFRDQIRQDWAFIPAYATFFAGMGVLLAFRPRLGWRVAAVIVAGLAVGATYCDVRENLGILAVLDAPLGQLREAATGEARWFSRLKWASCFLILVPIAAVFTVRRRGGLVPTLVCWATAGLFLAAAVIGLVGVSGRDSWIKSATALMASAIALGGLVMALVPETLRPSSQ